ncbi:hypothetical protein DFJ74DRAFT_770503, partial [Hyaloraphidium curvatum]
MPTSAGRPLNKAKPRNLEPHKRWKYRSALHLLPSPLSSPSCSSTSSPSSPSLAPAVSAEPLAHCIPLPSSPVNGASGSSAANDGRSPSRKRSSRTMPGCSNACSTSVLMWPRSYATPPPLWSTSGRSGGGDWIGGGAKWPTVSCSLVILPSREPPSAAKIASRVSRGTGEPS